MPNPKTDSGGFTTDNEDKNRDMGSKGGPSTTLGSPDDHHGISAPYDADLQTQIAAKGHKEHKNDPQKENTARDDNKQITQKE